MSAYIVMDSTINRVIGQLALNREIGHIAKIVNTETGCDVTERKDRNKLGAAMHALNVEAVTERYGSGAAEMMPDQAYSCRMEQTTLVQAYKSLRCWLYQCSEGDIPEKSLLFGTMQRVAAEMAEQIVSDMPAYQNAEWD